jgi:hypothetical protein
MTRRRRSNACAVVVLMLAAPGHADAATLQPHTLQGWRAYVAATEARIARELAPQGGFLVSDFSRDATPIRRAVSTGDIPIARLETRDAQGKTIAVPDGSISHWRGAVLLRGASLDTLLSRLQHPPEQGPHPTDVVALRVVNRRPDHLTLALRMTRSAIVTVTYDTEHAIEYRHHGSARVSSKSVSTRIVEVEDAGTSTERTLPEGQDRGFLWRMNSYWRYEQVAEGVIVELESLTLSRGIPLGLGMIVESTVERIARESIARTLDSVRRLYGGAAGRVATQS